MNGSEYKEVCSKPNVLQSDVLLKTLAALKKEGASEAKIIEAIIAGKPIPFPEKYDGDAQQCYYEVRCKAEEAEAITDILFDLEASSVPSDGVATTATYQYVGLVNIWSELTEYVSKSV
ncbi:MAG: hypothetical protein M8364_10140 [Methylobacter sp.]|jgi:hypothetical protein|uniref:hypothetical protein n=1 Tax=Methylobacter TaxID=429 RepID=UPI0003780746|nr:MULTISPECIES: hypothetical protein [Methylobacter]MCL7421248.1 hypothetical protein [Methylobacter sp.]